MWKTLLALSFALAGTGCFFGGEGDTSTVPDKKDSVAVVEKTKLLSSGLYVGDYTWIDSNKAGLESEFILNQNGSFQLFWVSENEAVYNLSGSWAQVDSNLQFHKLTESWVRNGIFSNFTEIEDDTNSLVNITDSSFVRREYTPLRQKPYWITYTKKNYPSLKEGEYQIVKTYPNPTPEDSLAKLDVKFRILLKGVEFSLSVTEDTLESFQASGKWSQLGSFLTTENNLQRGLIDSTKSFPSAWDTLGGVILQRLRTVSDTSFHMWNPPSFFDTGSWDDYHRAH
jgi:hypothetical protein